MSTLSRKAASAASALDAFQDGFAAALSDPDAGSSSQADIAALVSQPGFSIYRNTAMKGCIDALLANYPAVLRLVGAEWFRACASVFVRSHPPAHASLVDYGNGFGEFLASFAPAADLPYLPGVARLDRFWTEAHIATDEAPFRPCGQDDEHVVLRPLASARWRWFGDQPIFTIWSRNRAPGSDDASAFDWHGEGALVVRLDDVVMAASLDRAGCALLDAFAGGASIAAAIDAARARAHDAGLASSLAELLRANALARADPRQRASARER
jgi:hypothetical protein